MINKTGILKLYFFIERQITIYFTFRTIKDKNDSLIDNSLDNIN